MMIESIRLMFFKNYEQAEVTFSERFNALVGLNGSGKTNLLDAIHYLSMTKSAFNTIDSQNIHHHSDYFSLKGKLLKQGHEHQVHCSLKRNHKKVFRWDEVEYDRLSEHMGKFPIVLVAPNDDELIRDSHDTRRKYFDSLIAQFDSAYLEQLIQYNHYLKQRNALLKQFAEHGHTNTTLLETYHQPLVKRSKSIAQTRQAFIHDFAPYLLANYQTLSGERESVRAVYLTKALDEDFESQFSKSVAKDLALQRTSLGVHRDEYLFTIHDYPIKKYGSQGQQKSLLISLKLAQLSFIKQKTGITPLLLLDDIFDKLDDRRIRQLLEMIAHEKFGQVFITDAREERTLTQLRKNFDPTLFRIQNNCFTPL